MGCAIVAPWPRVRFRNQSILARKRHACDGRTRRRRSIAILPLSPSGRQDGGSIKTRLTLPRRDGSLLTATSFPATVLSKRGRPAEYRRSTMGLLSWMAREPERRMPLSGRLIRTLPRRWRAGAFSGLRSPFLTCQQTGISSTQWWFGPWPGGIYNDHQSAYNYYPFVLFGDRHWLDGCLHAGATDPAPLKATALMGRATSFDQTASFTFPAASGTPSAGKAFHGILYLANTCSQGPRAAAWMLRSLALGAGLGSDSTPERKLIQRLSERELLLLERHEGAQGLPRRSISGAWGLE